MKKFILFISIILFPLNTFALSKMETQEFYEQMSPYAICAAIALYNNDNELHNKLTSHMYDSLETFANGEFLSNTKRGFMVGYVSGMSQAVFTQIYKLQGEPQGLTQKEFAKFAQKKMCKNYL